MSINMNAKYEKGSYVKDLKTNRKVKIIHVFETKEQNNGRPYFATHEDIAKLY